MSERPATRTHRAAVAWGIALFLALSGATASHAYWTSATTNLTPALTGATINSTQTGLTGLTKTFTSSVMTTTAPVTITNTGNVASAWTYSFSAPASAAVTAATFTVWTVTATSQCTATATPSSPSTTTGSVPASRTGSLAVNAKAYFCVRIQMTAQGQSAAGSTRIELTGALVSNVGNWVGGQTATSTVTVADDRAPSAPSASTDRVSGYSARVNWSGASDNVGVAGYRIYRGTTLMATVDDTVAEWTDSSLASGTTYSYQVEAFDAAGGTARSSSTTASTLALASNATYEIFYPHGARCVDVWNWGNTAGTALAIWDCSNTVNQLFALRPTADGLYLFEPQNATHLVAGAPDAQVGTQLQLLDRSAANVGWRIEPQNGGYRVVNGTTGLCMDIAGMGTAAGTAVTSWDCLANESQTFTLRAR